MDYQGKSSSTERPDDPSDWIAGTSREVGSRAWLGGRSPIFQTYCELTQAPNADGVVGLPNVPANPLLIGNQDGNGPPAHHNEPDENQWPNVPANPLLIGNQAGNEPPAHHNEPDENQGLPNVPADPLLIGNQAGNGPPAHHNEPDENQGPNVPANPLLIGNQAGNGPLAHHNEPDENQGLPIVPANPLLIGNQAGNGPPAHHNEPAENQNKWIDVDKTKGGRERRLGKPVVLKLQNKYALLEEQIPEAAILQEWSVVGAQTLLLLCFLLIQDHYEPEAVQTRTLPKQRGKKKGRKNKRSSSPKSQDNKQNLQETARPAVESSDDLVSLKYLMDLPPGSPPVNLCVRVTKVDMVGSSGRQSRKGKPIAQCEVQEVEVDENGNVKVDESGKVKVTVAIVILKGDHVKSLVVGSFVLLVNARKLPPPYAEKIEAEIDGFQVAQPEEK